jgi:arylsulfatase A-like enzyme
LSLPNVLILHTDQQSCWTLSAYGGSLVQTSHCDRLAREGALFSNFITNSAVCTPSRGCLVTGRYPHSHGAYTNNVPLNRDEVTFAQILHDNGYETGYAGKWHLDGTPRPGWVHPERSMGFHDSRYMFNRGHWKQIRDMPMADTEPLVFPYEVIGDARTYTTDWLCDKAIAFIERPRTAPFCYMLSLPDPHTPFTVRPPYDSMFDPQDMPLPATFGQENLPRWAEAARENGPYALGNLDREGLLRRNKAQYCGEVKCIDDNVGRILECLESRGILDDTVVVFTTDHGEYMGEHGLLGKNQLYETAYRIPLLVRWPEAIAPGTVVDQVCATVDFQPTLLGLLGIGPCGREQGSDASPLLRGGGLDWPPGEAFVHHSSHRRAGILTTAFMLAYVEGGEAILFDRENDSDQVHNLFAKPGYEDVVQELTERIVQHHEQTRSPAAAWLRALGALDGLR